MKVYMQMFYTLPTLISHKKIYVIGYVSVKLKYRYHLKFMQRKLFLKKLLYIYLVCLISKCICISFWVFSTMKFFHLYNNEYYEKSTQINFLNQNINVNCEFLYTSKWKQDIQQDFSNIMYKIACTTKVPIKYKNRKI